MIAYSIQAALASRSIDEVWVSTDDPDIASIANRYGAKTPFKRPSHLADDFTILGDVMVHAMNFAIRELPGFKYACMIFATAPLITSDDIDEGKNVLEITGADLALAVTEFRSAPQRAQYVDDNGYLQYEYPENYSVRTQDLKNMYHDAAQFVWGKSSSFLAPVTDLNIAPVRIAAERVIDIDTVEDWNYAEYLYLAHHNRNLKLVG